MRRAHRYGGVAVALAVIASSACSGDSLQGDETWAVDGPVVDTRAIEDRLLLGDVADVALLRDGGLAVVDRALRRLVVVEPSGEVRFDVGGEGEGPGEFMSAERVWSPDASRIRVYDDRSSRVTTFGVDGSLLKVVRLEPAGWRPSLFLGELRDGRLVFTGVIPPPARSDSEERLDSMQVGWFGPNGDDQGVLGLGRGMRRFGSSLDPVSPVALGVAYGDSVVFAAGLDAIVSVLHPTQAEIPVDVGLARPDPETARARLAEELARRGQDGLVDRLADTRIGGEIPRIASLLVDDRGRLWVKPYDPGSDALWLRGGPRRTGGGEWMVFEPGGDRLARLVVPDRFTPTDVSGDLLAGFLRDSLDVPHPVAYRVVR